jgi:hypothetical protein
MISLLIFSMLFNLIGETFILINLGVLVLPVNLKMIVMIAGGILSIKLSVSKQSFYIFIVVYSFMWIFRYIINFAGNQIGEIIILNKHVNFHAILNYYYESISRITSPLPFLFFWFINYLFNTNLKKTD